MSVDPPPRATFPITKITDIPGYEQDNWSRGKSRYPWDKCENVGDSFFVTDRKVNQMASAAALCNASRLRGWKFSCRTERDPKGNLLGIRVIRIK